MNVFLPILAIGFIVASSVTFVAICVMSLATFAIEWNVPTWIGIPIYFFGSFMSIAVAVGFWAMVLSKFAGQP